MVKSVSGCCGSAPIRAPLRPSSSVVRDLSPAPPVSPPEGGPRQQSVRARRPSCHLPDRPGGCLQVSKSVRTSARASVPTLSVSSPRRAPASQQVNQSHCSSRLAWGFEAGTKMSTFAHRAGSALHTCVFVTRSVLSDSACQPARLCNSITRSFYTHCLPETI